MLFVLICSVLTNLTEAPIPLLDVDQERLHKEKFYSLFEAKITEDELQNPEKKRKITRSVTNLIEYQELVNLIEAAMNKKNSKTQKEYYLLNKYEILVVGET